MGDYFLLPSLVPRLYRIEQLARLVETGAGPSSLCVVPVILFLFSRRWRATRGPLAHCQRERTMHVLQGVSAPRIHAVPPGWEWQNQRSLYKRTCLAASLSYEITGGAHRKTPDVKEAVLCQTPRTK